MTTFPSTTTSPMVPVAPATGRLSPVGLQDVTIDGGFWKDLQDRNHHRTLPHIRDWIEKAGWVDNFRLAVAGGLPEGRRGREFSDSEIYKWLEAMAWEIGRTGDAGLQEQFDEVVAVVAAAQEPDGYVNTRFGRPGQQPRYSDLEWGHELYCHGHLIQAGVARLRTGHDDLLVEIARSAADHICSTFGPDGLQAICGHPEIEPALAELGRATGEGRYLDQAALFVERRGHHTLEDIEWGRSYFQDDEPVRTATQQRGHVVRAMYLASGAVDVAVDTGDEELLAALRHQWADTVARRTYVTGGMGSQHMDEAFGPDHFLPPDRAYAETCAGIGSIMFSWRLLLATGGDGYADLIERTLFNVLATSPSAAGTEFFYTNTLHQRQPGTIPDPDAIVPRASSSLRAPWFEVSCCPPNVARTLASLAGYLATTDVAGLQLHQYADATIRTELGDGRKVAVRTRTDYPRSGRIDLEIIGDQVGEWTLSLRVPSWAAGSILTDQSGSRGAAPGTITITRNFAPGELITLDLPIVSRWTFPAETIDAIRDCVAVERGPLVMCLESVDIDADSVNGIRIDTAGPLVDRVDQLDSTITPWVLAHGSRIRITHPDWPYSNHPHGPDIDGGRRESVVLPLVPYHLWANRGPGTMRVWIPLNSESERQN